MVKAKEAAKEATGTIAIASIILLLLALCTLCLSGCGSKGSTANESIEAIDNGSSGMTSEIIVTDTEIPHEEPLTPEECGDSKCAASESCTSCPADCGECPFDFTGNFSLKDIQADLDKVLKGDVILRKDLTEKDEAVDFFYSESKMIRYIAEFLDLQYTELKKSREVVLTHILLGPSFIKDEGSLFTLVNSSRWFLVDRIIEDEKKIYESRMKDKEATKIYPSDPSGYKKAQRYDEWELMNHTSKDDLVMDKVEKLDNGLVLTTYAGMTTYRLTYRFTTSEERSENIILYDTKEVTETKLNFVNTISFSCSPETVVTVYDYSYDSQFPIDRENLRLQADAMKYRLINTAKRLQQSCSAKYRTKMFLADGDAAIR